MPGYDPSTAPSGQTVITISSGTAPLEIAGVSLLGSCPPETIIASSQNEVNAGRWIKALGNGKVITLSQVNASGQPDVNGQSLLVEGVNWNGKTLLLENGYQHVADLGLTLEPGVEQTIFTPDGTSAQATGFTGGGKFSPSVVRHGNETATAYTRTNPENFKTDAWLSITNNNDQTVIDIALAETVITENAYNVIAQPDGSYLIPVTSSSTTSTAGVRIDLYRVSPAPLRTVTSVWNAPEITDIAQEREGFKIIELSSGKKLLTWYGLEQSGQTARQYYGAVLNNDFSTFISPRALGSMSVRGEGVTTQPIGSDKFAYTYVDSNNNLRIGVRNADSTFSVSSPEIAVKLSANVQYNSVLSIDPDTGKIYVTFSEYGTNLAQVIYTAEFTLNETTNTLVAGPVVTIEDRNFLPEGGWGPEAPSAAWTNPGKLTVVYQRPVTLQDSNVYKRTLDVATGVVGDELIVNPSDPVYSPSFPSQPGNQAYGKIVSDGQGKGDIVYSEGPGGQNIDLRLRSFTESHVSDPIRVVRTPGSTVTIKDGVWIFLANADITLQLNSEQQKSVYLDGSQQYSLLLTASATAKRDVHAKREGETPKLILSGLNSNTTITLAPDLSGALQFAPMGNGTVLSIGGINYAEFPNTPIATVQQALGVAPTTPPAPTPEEPTPAPVPVPAPTPTPQPPVEEPSSPPELPPSPPVEEPVSPPPTEVPVQPTTPPVTNPPAPTAGPGFVPPSPSGEVTPPPHSASNRLQPPSIFFVPFMLLNKGRDLLQLATQKFLAPANTNAEPEVVAESTVVPLNITVTPLSPEQSSDTVSVLAAQFITQAKANGWHVDEEAAAHAFANGEFSYDTQSRSVTFSPETKAALESSLTSSTALFGQGLAKSSALNFVSGFVDGWQFSSPERKLIAQLAVQTGHIAITALSGASALYLAAGNLVGEGVSRFYSPTIGGLITESVKTISDALLMSGPLPLYAAKVVADVAKPLLQVGGSYAAQYLQGQAQQQDEKQSGSSR